MLFILSLAVLFPLPGLSAEELALQNLYAFQFKDNEGAIKEDAKLQILLTAAPHEERLPYRSLPLGQGEKVSLFVSSREDLAPTFFIDFFMGGKDEYVAYINGRGDPLVSSLGQISRRDGIQLYVGTRRNPSYLDGDAWRFLRENACVPVLGLRCVGMESADPIDSLAKSNVLVFVADIPFENLDAVSRESGTELKIWAKAYVEK